MPAFLGMMPNTGVTMVLLGNLFHRVFSRPQDLILGPFLMILYYDGARDRGLLALKREQFVTRRFGESKTSFRFSLTSSYE